MMSVTTARHACVLAALFTLAACGAPQNQASGTNVVPAVNRLGAGPATKAYGVGLADGAGTVPTWGAGWCNGVPAETLSFCPDEVPGKRSFKNSASGGRNLENGSGQPEGYVKAKINVTQKLGATSYLLDGEVDVLDSQIIAEAGATISNGWWQDEFTISSQTLKNGTPVTLGVQAALNPTETNVACDAAQTSVGELFIYSASITPSSGSQFSISGDCVSGTFEYLLGNGVQGTTETGTISTAVGDKFTVYFVMTGDVAVCEDNKNQACLGLYAANLGGSYQFTVTSITSGATYTTASGNMY